MTADEKRTPESRSDEPQHDRREALKTIVRGAVYAAPTAAVLLAGARDARAGADASVPEEG